MSLEQDNLELVKIWDECRSIVERICRAKLQSCPSEVEDLVSDVFAALVDETRKRKIPDYPMAWLSKVTHNLINKKYKQIEKEKRIEHVNFDESEELALQVIYNFDEKEYTDEDIYIMKTEILSKLPPDEQYYIDLVCDKKLKYKEIAILYNISEYAAKQRFYRLKRKTLKEYEKFKKKRYLFDL